MWSDGSRIRRKHPEIRVVVDGSDPSLPTLNMGVPQGITGCPLIALLSTNIG